ncbi:MAG: hypothetical protein ACK559_20825 [bacterium]
MIRCLHRFPSFPQFARYVRRISLPKYMGGYPPITVPRLGGWVRKRARWCVHHTNRPLFA